MALFAVALAGCGLLTTAGVIVSMDTFGPVSDNAQGIAEMSGDIDKAGAQVLTDLDAVGNTTKAITKGIAIATAVLAATALFGSFTRRGRHRDREDTDVQPASDNFALHHEPHPAEQPGRHRSSARRSCSCSAASPISAVGRAAGRVVFEVREQFRTKPGIMDFTEKPDYAASSTSAPGFAARTGHARACWRSSRRSRSASRSAPARLPATSPVRSRPAC